MKAILLVLAVLSFLIQGCSHTYVLNKESKANFVPWLNREAAGNKGVIITKDRNRIEIRNIHVSNDTVFADALRVPTVYAVALNDVHKISITKPTSRSNRFLLGFLTGFAIGGAIGLMSGDDPPEQWIFRLSAGQKGLMLGTTFGLVGGTFASGAEVSEQDEFVFGEQLSPKFYLLKGVKIINETETSIQIDWHGKTAWLYKSEIMIEKTDEGVDVRVPDRLYQEKF